MKIYDEFYQGEPKTYNGYVTDGNGDAVDCTGYSIKVRVVDASDTLVVEYDSSIDSEIYWTTIASGLYSFDLSPTDTTQAVGLYDIEVRLFNGATCVATVSTFQVRIKNSLFVTGV